MVKSFSVRATARAQNRRQAYALLVMGVLFLVAAWLVHLVLSVRPGSYPLGVLLLGVGMLVAAMLNPRRLLVAAWLTTMLGIAVFLAFKGLIPGNQVLAAYILAIGLGLLGIAWAGRRGYVGAGAVTPGILVVIVGAIEYLLAQGLTPTQFIPFMLSLWLPGAGLLIIGLAYLLTAGGRE
ncbi:MAG: hypothetical protein H0U76_12470 [Ktedonobacteraceae bacterium]|nr:hypothetical protein [Ktedonobacteraceae bacterium]